MKRDPKELKTHPALMEFPMLTLEQFEALKQSIRERGMLKAIVTDGADQVIDGRNRMKAALELGLEEVPVEVLDGVDPISYAIETAITGRQLTKTAVCLMLLEHSPELAAEKGQRKVKSLKNGEFSRVPWGNTGESFRAIGDKYQVPFKYFSYICTCLGLCRNVYNERRLRLMVYALEVSATNLEKAVLGWQRTHPIDEVVDDDELLNEPVPRRADVNIVGGYRRAMIWFRDQGKLWTKLPADEQGMLRDLWSQTIKAMPEELRRMVK